MSKPSYLDRVPRAPQQSGNGRVPDHTEITTDRLIVAVLALTAVVCLAWWWRWTSKLDL